MKNKILAPVGSRTIKEEREDYTKKRAELFVKVEEIKQGTRSFNEIDTLQKLKTK